MDQLHIKNKAKKFLKTLSPHENEKIIQRLRLLQLRKWEELDIISLQGKKEKLSRMRWGNYRIIFRKDKEDNSIYIIKITDRKESYTRIGRNLIPGKIGKN